MAGSPDELTRSTHSQLTLWLALGVEAFFAVLSIAAYALRLHVITSIETGAPLSQQTVVSSDHFVRIVAQLSVPMLIIVLVILLVWVRDARKNLEAFRAGPFLYSPGMAVGSSSGQGNRGATTYRSPERRTATDRWVRPCCAPTAGTAVLPTARRGRRRR